MAILHGTVPASQESQLRSPETACTLHLSIMVHWQLVGLPHEECCGVEQQGMVRSE